MDLIAGELDETIPKLKDRLDEIESCRKFFLQMSQ